MTGLSSQSDVPCSASFGSARMHAGSPTGSKLHAAGGIEAFLYLPPCGQPPKVIKIGMQTCHGPGSQYLGSAAGAMSIHAATISRIGTEDYGMFEPLAHPLPTLSQLHYF